MGGPGSGRHFRTGTKYTTADFRQLDIRNLDQEDVLDRPGQWIRWCWWDAETGEKNASINVKYEPKHTLYLSYSVDGEDKNYPVPVDWTDCNFGGERPGFRCPGDNCGRRCAILYLHINAVCRKCRDLTYYRCNISGDQLKIYRHKLRKIAEQLDIDKSKKIGGAMDWLPPDRPKHMHRETYLDLMEQWHELQEQCYQAFQDQLAEYQDKLENFED
jgi:hypothetical protein